MTKQHIQPSTKPCTLFIEALEKPVSGTVSPAMMVTTLAIGEECDKGK